MPAGTGLQSSKMVMANFWRVCRGVMVALDHRVRQQKHPLLAM